MRQTPDSVMLFAAGFGTRMGPLTRDMPKPMIPVAGKPLIDHALDLVERVSPARTVVNLHYKPEALERHLADRDVLLSRETPDILDTGGGLKAAAPHLGNGPVYTLNSDAVWSGPNPLAILRDAWTPDRMQALVLCVDRADAHAHPGKGDFVTAGDGRAERGPGMIYTGAQIIQMDTVTAIPDTVFSLNTVWDHLIARGTLCAIRYPGSWCDVGTPDGIKTAEALLEASGV